MAAMPRKYASAAERQKAYRNRNRNANRNANRNEERVTIEKLQEQLNKALAENEELKRNAPKPSMRGRGAIPNVSLFPSNSSSFEGCELSPEMDCDSFRRALTEYLEYRKEKGRKFKKLGVQKLISRLTKWGPERAAAAIEYSMANGWDGIFEDKENGKHPAPAANLEDELARLKKLREAK
jgi:hypothetical protein